VELGPETDDVEVTRTDARRIAFLSDTHTRTANGSELPKTLLDAIRGADLIVHLGHIGTPGCLDRLATVAKTLGCRTALDDMTFGALLDHEIKSGRTSSYVRVIEARQFSIAALQDLTRRGIGQLVHETRLAFPDGSVREILRSKFGRVPDVVAFANTHAPQILLREGTLYVNPGSPNLPGDWRKGGPGTFARLEIAGKTLEAEIVDLARPPPR